LLISNNLTGVDFDADFDTNTDGLLKLAPFTIDPSVRFADTSPILSEQGEELTWCNAASSPSEQGEELTCKKLPSWARSD